MAAPVHLSKLTSALRQLSPVEMEKLEAYLSSPYFEIPTGALPLFQYLRKFHPAYDEKKTDPAVIQKKAPALGNQKRQANYGSDLLKCLEQFLAVEDFKATPDSVDRHRLQAYKKHHLFEMFNKEHEQITRTLNKNIEQDIDVFYQRHILTELALTGFDIKLNRTINNDTHPVTETLDVFYAIKKLRYHCELLNRHRVLGTPYEKENVPFLLETLNLYNSVEYPYVYLFVNVYQMLDAKTFEEGEAFHISIQKIVQKESDSNLSVSIKETIDYAINHCQFWINRGFRQASVAALWWQELRIKHNILLENNRILPNDFRNIIVLAILNLKDAAWIKRFIDAYANLLPAEHIDTNKAFALAQYYYYSQNYDEAMPLFQQAQVKEEPIFNAIVRRWQFMCMYEKNPEAFDLLFDFLDAYEKYVLRNAASFHQSKDLFIKNIAYSKKLLKAGDTAKKKELAQALNAEGYVTGKEWLLKQL